MYSIIFDEMKVNEDIYLMPDKRNGFDSLSFATLVLAVVFFALGSVMYSDYSLIAYAAAVALTAYTLFRVLSLNTARRRYEADLFSSLFKKNPYRKFKCPSCKTLCRVPKGKGKIRIHCPACNHEFIKRT